MAQWVEVMARDYIAAYNKLGKKVVVEDTPDTIVYDERSNGRGKVKATNMRSYPKYFIRV